jgi:hypothetical protein
MSFIDHITIGPWDLVLVGIVSLQATLIAYAATPRIKSVFLTLPLPFTAIALAVGLPMHADNVLGILLGQAYTHAIRLLHDRLGLPIIAAILLPLSGYTVVGWLAADWVPRTPLVFWVSSAVVLLVGVVLLLTTLPRAERAHRTELPVWLKLPAVLAVVFLLVVVKQELRGFATLFPLVSVVGAYETRHCLWTLTRTVPTFTVCLVPMVCVAHLTQDVFGLGWSLVVGWSLFLAIHVPVTRWQWRRWPEPL